MNCEICKKTIISDEELRAINSARMLNGMGFSKISQDLFWNIYLEITDKFKEIYFATKKDRDNTKNRFDEYMLKIGNRTYFLDFFIKDINVAIEFDGDYWHSEARGNVERDRLRDEKIRTLGIKLLHIKERDYRTNKSDTVAKCIEFIVKCSKEETNVRKV